MLVRLLLIKVVMACAALAGLASAQELVSFPTQDGGLIFADLYGKGDRGLVLAHGGRFNKESWEKQARVFETAGFRVLAIDFRGRGQSRGPGQADIMSAPLQLDVLGAVRYLRKTGAKTVRWSVAAWAALPRATLRLLPNPVRLIASCSWARPRTARPKNSS